MGQAPAQTLHAHSGWSQMWVRVGKSMVWNVAVRWWQEFILLHIIALLVITGGMGLCKHGGGEHCKYCSPIVKCSDLVLCPALGITRTRGDPSKHGAEATFHTFVIIAIERYNTFKVLSFRHKIVSFGRVEDRQWQGVAVVYHPRPESKHNNRRGSGCPSCAPRHCLSIITKQSFISTQRNAAGSKSWHFPSDSSRFESLLLLESNSKPLDRG